jgi:UDP-GlcNAc:undecaprenyl-phosphate GlcNAc-1-phosphate transferase
VLFPTNAYLAALVGSFLVATLTLPLWRAWCSRTGHMDDPGDRKIHGRPIALAGGLAVLTGILLPVLTAILLFHSGAAPEAGAAEIRYGFDRRGFQLVVILAGAVGMALLGWLDDRHELRAGGKFAGQLCIAIAVAAADVRITLFVENLWFSYVVTIFWILAVVNALNFMDNMNGLCTGLGAIGAGSFGCIAVMHGQYLVGTLCLLACGALLGFLPHNYPEASAFLGDAGSHLVGFLLGVLAILPDFYSAKHPKYWAAFTPLLILAVPLLDMAWVVWRRWQRGQPFYMGDTTHLSHRLVQRGLSKAQAVAAIWAVAAGCAGFAIWLNR